MVSYPLAVFICMYVFLALCVCLCARAWGWGCVCAGQVRSEAMRVTTILCDPICNISCTTSDYMNDPYSEKNPMNTICSRGDLLEKPEAGGCYDTKVNNKQLHPLEKTICSFSGHRLLYGNEYDSFS